MIFVTGDIHGDPERLNTTNFPRQKEMGKDDYMIICGDFGLVWEENKEGRNERWWLNWLQDKSFTTLFVDGNHENFDRLNAYPVEDWHGGKVHFILENVIHLMRGEMFDLCGKKVFAFGGARSHDIDGEATKEELEKDYTAGILQKDEDHLYGKLRRLRNYGLYTRVEGKSWWRAEMPTEEEMEHGLQTLKNNGMKTDFIISHDGPTSDIILANGRALRIDPLNQYFEKIRQETDYKAWYFGHHHLDTKINDRDTVIYEKITQIC